MLVRVGLAQPFRMGAADIATETGDALRRTHIGEILATRASSAGMIGELPWDTDRGSALDALRQAKEGEAFADLTAVYTIDALAQALPRERVTAVDTVIDGEMVEITATTEDSADTSPRPLSLTTTVQVRP